MSPKRLITLVFILAVAITGGLTTVAGNEPLSPTALVATQDGKTLFVACATANRVLVCDSKDGTILDRIDVPHPPLGLALTRDGKQLFVTCAAPESTICIVDVSQRKILRKIVAGHTAMAPTLSPDDKTLYICHRFNNAIAFIDVERCEITKRVAVPREPVAAALSLDGKFLLAANHLHAGRADLDVVASSVSVIDTVAAKVVKELALPNGSGLLRGIAVSPDGHYACVTHLLSRFHLPTTQLERGWVNTSALTLIDLAGPRVLNTVLLDNIDSGAANPWAVTWTADQKHILVTHAGTHEVSVIDAPGLLTKLAQIPVELDHSQPRDYTVASRVAADVPNDLSFLVGLRRRVKLPDADRGPRAILSIGVTAYVANYFSDSLAVLDLNTDQRGVTSISLGRNSIISTERRGEFYFNDATICFQGWQSCASCHSSDARVDGLNWDNLNDGIGNPKNAKSLLLAHETPPSMWLGIRSNADTAVRAGIRNSLFTVQSEEVAATIDAYLNSLKPIPSPRLVKGQLSNSASRGKKLFSNPVVGCADCHRGAFYCDRKLHDVGTGSQFDKPTDRFDTPTLIEAWRTAPYLHDGSAATIRDVLTTRNIKGRHGNLDRLTSDQIDDLAEYVLSL